MHIPLLDYANKNKYSRSFLAFLGNIHIGIRR